MGVQAFRPGSGTPIRNLYLNSKAPHPAVAQVGTFMRRLVLKMCISIDGFIGGPHGEVDWIFETLDESATAWLEDTLWQAGVHIMGSHTFRDMAAYWPCSSERLAAPMNQIPKIVFSKKGLVEPRGPRLTATFRDPSLLLKSRSTSLSPNVATWTDAAVASGDLTEEIGRLKRQPGKDILAHGGARFVQSLVKLGLIDEYRLLIHPVVLGSGLRLFANLERPLDLTLVSTTVFGGGTVAHVYRPGGESRR